MGHSSRMRDRLAVLAICIVSAVIQMGAGLSPDRSNPAAHELVTRHVTTSTVFVAGTQATKLPNVDTTQRGANSESPNPQTATAVETAAIGPAGQSSTAAASLHRATTLKVGLSYGDTLFADTPIALGATLDDASALGVGWIRVDLSWNDIQNQSPSKFNWGPFDAIVKAASARHLEVLPIIAYTPGWARGIGCGSDKCSPASSAQFASFASEAASRYAPLGVHDWEIWNEPNVVGFWKPTPDPIAYAGLLRLTSIAIHRVDGSATVISGGLAPAATIRGDISQLGFLSGLCRAGGLSWVDAIGYHPYSFPVPPNFNKPWNAWAQISQTAPSFESIMTACGQGSKKIWITEYGAPTNGPAVGATVNNYQIGRAPDHVDEALQAQMATDSVALAASTPTVGALFWYTNKDLGNNPTNREDYFGLRRFDGTPKPAWASLHQAIAALQK